MKNFFKAVVQIKYTSNPDKLDFSSLQNYLKENQMVGDDFDFEGQINQFDQLIQTLIQQGDDQENKFEETCNQIGIDDDRDIKDLKVVWNNDKEYVYSDIIKQNTSYKKLDKFEWSINNKFYGKKVKNLKEVTCVTNLKLTDFRGQDAKYLTFEMNSSELQQLNEDLSKIEDEIRNFFEPPPEEKQEDNSNQQ